MFLIKQRLYIFIFLSFLFVYVSPTWGMREDNDLNLVKAIARHYSTGDKKPVFQIMGKNGKPLHDPKLFFDIAQLLSSLKFVEEENGDKIQTLLDNAYNSLKKKLDDEYTGKNPTLLRYENSIDEAAIKGLFKNYWDELNEEDVINNVTGTSLTMKERQALKTYMEHCDAIYTNCYTRNFISAEHMPKVGEKLSIIRKRKEIIEDLILSVNEIEKTINGLNKIKSTYEQVSGLYWGIRQVKSKEAEFTKQSIKPNLSFNIDHINTFLSTIHESSIPKNANIFAVQEKLLSVQSKINSEYEWYFQGDFKKSLEKKGKNPPLTPKARIAFSFLSNLELLEKVDIKNTTIIDVGFRNKEVYGSWWNKFVTNAAVLKANPDAWFQEHGEVDYIAYIEQDPHHIEDKLVITYSGSNSQKDWGLNFTPGYTTFYGLEVHKGIGWLFNESKRTYWSTLMQRIENYYTSHQKPMGLKIITAGHSLGGALAELAAYYCQTQQQNSFKKILDPNEKNWDKIKISLKTFTYGAPAIFDKSSKKIIEHPEALGRKNIYRCWTGNDIVANYTDSEKSYIARLMQGAEHVGKSIPLYNIQCHSINMGDVWWPHGATRYLSYLNLLTMSEICEEHKIFTDILNSYIKDTELYTYKKNRRLRNNLERGNLSNEYKISEEVATKVMRLASFNPISTSLPQTNDGIQVLNEGILRYLINYPQDYTKVPLEDGAKVASYCNTYHKITEIIHLEKINLLNELINLSDLKNIFSEIKDKKEKFESFRINFKKTLKEFQSRNTVGTKPIHPYEKNLQVFDNYLNRLKQEVLEHTSWQIIPPHQ